MGAGIVVWGLLACAGAPDDSAPAADDSALDTVDSVGDTSNTTVEVLDDTAPVDTGDPDVAAAEYADLYDDSVVQQFQIELDADARKALLADPTAYVRGTLVHGETRLEGVGIRLDGADADTQTFDGKPSFRIKLREFEDRWYAGVSHLELHNLEDDPAQLREVLSARLLEDAGIPAAKATFAEVTLDGELLGLYANVEVIDGHFVDRRWDDGDGDLWQAGDAADFTPAGQDDFELVSGFGDTDALDAARRQIQLGEGPFYDVANVVVDMSGFLDVWAWELLLANPDSYPFQLDDYFLYADPDDSGRFHVIPESLDETWDAEMDVEAAPGTLAVHCSHDDACAALLAEHLTTALAAWDAADPLALAEAAATVSEDAVSADPRRTVSATEVLAARSTLLTTMTTWPETLREE